MSRKIVFTVFGILVGLLCISSEVMSQKTMRLFLVGNSVTDAINYDGLKSLAVSRGNTHVWARHMIPGSPLELLWDMRNGDGMGGGGFTTDPYGFPQNAFTVYSWDAISLQPFDRSIDGSQGDLAMVNNYINLAKGKSPDARICIYSRWPRNPLGSDVNFPPAEKFTDLWDNCSGQANECRSFFQSLVTAVKQIQPVSNIVMIPVGEVFYELNKKMIAGTVPGYTSIWSVYSDGIHMKGIGSYIAACTYYSVLYADDPVGLPVTGEFGTIAPQVALIIQQTARDVVLAQQQWTKVDYFGPAPVMSVGLNLTKLELNADSTAVLQPVFVPSNAANKAVTWESTQTAFAVVDASGKITAKSSGTTDIIVTTADGGKKDTCQVTVVPATNVAVTSVFLNETSFQLLIGTSEKLACNVLPPTATNNAVVWASSNSNIASVDGNGNVTPLKKGVAVISATSLNAGKVATCTVSVSPVNTPPIAKIVVNPSTGYAPLKVHFDGQTSVDNDPDDFVLGFDWYIIHGKDTLSYQNCNAFDYVFTSPGTYKITLRAMDSNNQRSNNTDSVSVSVMQLPPVPSDEPALCYEGFNYVNTNMHGLNGGRGFREAWNVQNPNANSEIGYAPFVTNPVLYPGLKMSGNHAQGGMSYMGCGRGLDINATGIFKNYIANSKIGKNDSVLWFSVLLRPHGTNKNCNISLSTNNISWACGDNDRAVGFGSWNNNYWGFKFKGSDAVFNASKVSLVSQKAVFLVAKIEFGSTNKVSLYVNPTPGMLPVKADTVAVTTDNIGFSAINYYVGNAPDGGSVDEIRFGSTYLQVAPAAAYYQVTVTDGSVLGDNTSFPEGLQVTIKANAPSQGKLFDKWTGDVTYLDDATKETAVVTMPAQDVAYVATYKDVYALTITSGSGSGVYTEGTAVAIVANPAPTGKLFDKWNGDTIYIDDVRNSHALVTMPALAISLLATYKMLPLGISPLSLGEAVKLYPNPSHGEFFIELPLCKENMLVQILDMPGSVMYSKEISSEGPVQFDLRDKAKGVYYLRIFLSGSVIIKKIVVY
jgi:hypothetical protein